MTDWISPVDRARVPNDPLSRLTALESGLNGVLLANVDAQSIDEFADDLGTFTAGQIVMASAGAYPGDGQFSGLLLTAYGYTLPDGTVVNIGGWQNDQPQFYISSVNGVGAFAGGNATLGIQGAIFSGIGYFIRFDATNAGNNRRLEMGTFLSGNVPAGYITAYDPTPNTNLETNGDFELGTLADWTQTGSTWDVVTSPAHGGLYAARLTLTDVIDSNLQTNGNFELGNLNDWTAGGTGSWSAVTTPPPHSGTYSALFTGTANQTGTLTTNLGGTPRMAVTAGVDYALDAWYLASSSFSTKEILVKWYNNTPTLISTTTITLPAKTGSFGEIAQLMVAPATAVWAEIVINLVRNGSGGSIVAQFDDIQFGAVSLGTLYTNFGGGTPRMAVTAGSSYQTGCYVNTDQAANFLSTASIAIRWYDAITGGNLLSITTTPISVISGSWVNSATPLVAPPGALGAETLFTFKRSAATSTWGSTIHVYVDDVTFASLTTSRRYFFLPDLTAMDGPFGFAEVSDPSTPASGYGDTYFSNADHAEHTLNSYGVNLVAGTQQLKRTIVSVSGETDLLIATAKRGSMGANGRIGMKALVLVKNNKGSPGTAQFKVHFGTKAVTVFNSATINNSTTTRTALIFDVEVRNANAQNSQEMIISMRLIQNVAAESETTGSTNVMWALPAIDTSAADTNLKITVNLSATDPAFFASGSGSVDGPFYAA